MVARRAARPSLFTFEESLFRTITRWHTAARIDEGAWGKGWALDRAGAAMLAAGAASFVLDLGGQVLAVGEETRVAVAHPRDRDRARSRRSA